MLSRKQKALVYGLLITHDLKLESILIDIESKDKQGVAKELSVTWAQGLYNNIRSKVRTPDRMDVANKARILNSDQIKLYEEMSSDDLEKVLDIVARIKGGNRAFCVIDDCVSCHTGTWINGECNKCGSQRFPGHYNQRLKKKVASDASYVFSVINFYFKDVELSSYYHTLVNEQCGPVGLQKDIIEFVANNILDPRMESLKGRKVKGQLAIRSRLTNRLIPHGHLSDRQLLRAVFIYRSLDRLLIDNKRKNAMKFNKMMKRVQKAIENDKSMQLAIVPGTSYPKEGKYLLSIESKNRSAFRFFRDQFNGEEEKAIDRTRTTGGHMLVNVTLGEHAKLDIDLYDSSGSKEESFTVTYGGITCTTPA